MLNIYVLTLNWNGKNQLSELYPTLKASLEHIKNLSWKWFIRDNGSIDGSVELINSWNDPNINCFPISHNRDTFACGCNYLFNQTNCNDEDFILLLNNDIVFEDRKSLHNMINIFDNDDVGLVGAKTLFKDNGLIQHAGVVFHTYNGLPLHFGANQKDNALFSKNREFQAVTGACWLTKAKYYKNISSASKGLSEEYIWMFEDIDACLAIKYDMGKKVVCCGETNILHDESSSLKKNPMNKLFAQKNINTFLGRWRGKYKLDIDIYNSNNKYSLYK